MTELILNSNEHKVDVNKLRYEFKSPIKFDNSFISLTLGIFYNFFHNVKQDHEMKVKKDNTYYNISFIDSMFEVEDINKIVNDELIRHELLTEEDPPMISIIPDINAFKIIILVERRYELHLDDNFAHMLGFSYKILKKICKEVIKHLKLIRLTILKFILILLIISIILIILVISLLKVM